MKPFIIILLLLSYSIGLCRAQDTTVVLSYSMFPGKNEIGSLSNKAGWIFKEGHDTTWANPGLNTGSWKKFKPSQLKDSIADKNGKAEGWFRIKIKIDSSFTGIPIAFRLGTWAAKDLYLDGKLIASFGNTGRNGLPYRESRDIGKLPIVFPNLEIGKEYTIALHVVDHLSPFPPFSLKSADAFSGLIMVVGARFYAAEMKAIKKDSFLNAVWTSVSGILSLLFWILVIMNKREKNLRLFAFCSTFASLAFFCFAASTFPGISHMAYMLFETFGLISMLSFVSSMPIVVARIFQRKIHVSLKVILLVLQGTWVISLFYPRSNDLTGSIALFCFAGIIFFCIYYLISSRKSLHGAQWAIVWGVLLTLSVIITVFVMALMNFNQDDSSDLFQTGMALIFPISLWVYVIMRFKEHINEVELNAGRVLQLSEEKKEEALNREKILQEEVALQTAEIRSTLENLKATQAQLIQSEKMASLGELTAGIAHEIQNPLNFVNNFSEVSNELIEELKTEKAKPKAERDDKLEEELLNDIAQNLEKINHHGKRADGIVKGMLQHSRSSTATKEPTDLNKLADEYLRLAYHGLRAKDKSFNATMNTEYDESIGEISVIPQDIGRVILNLITNAFYAAPLQPEGGVPDLPYKHEPTIWVSTKKTGEKVSISVRDNGPGIPQKVLDKIFQPFFTTKPTGQGTGLGLSLSYDIIKAHGGELRVVTKEGEGAEFIVALPL